MQITVPQVRKNTRASKPRNTAAIKWNLKYSKMTWKKSFHTKKIKLLCKPTRSIPQRLWIHRIKQQQERLWIRLKVGSSNSRRVQRIRWKQNQRRTLRNQIKIINQSSFLWAGEIQSLTSFQQLHRLKAKKNNKKEAHWDNQLMSPLDKLTNCHQVKKIK